MSHNSRHVDSELRNKTTRRVLGGLTFIVVLQMVAFLATVNHFTSHPVGDKSSRAASMTHPGAEGNYAILPVVPNLAATVSVSDATQLQNALQGALAPGTVIELNDGTYSGGQFHVNAASIGTIAQPIIIRAKNKYQATITNCGAATSDGGNSYCFFLEGTHAVLTGLTFTNTRWTNVNVRGRYNRVTDNRFIDAGDNTVANSGGFDDSIIGSFGGGETNVSALIDSNYILRPRNIPFAISETSRGIIMSHNTIEGPNAITLLGERESNAFKIGCCDTANEVAFAQNPTYIQFNTIKNFGFTDPYLGSTKVPYTRFLYNSVIGMSGNTDRPYVWETRGKVSQGSIIFGNYFEDGALVLEDSNQTVMSNIVVAKTSWYGVGPLIMHATQGSTNAYGVYDPYFYTAVTDSDVESNVFAAQVDVFAVTNVQSGGGPCDLARNLFSTNYFLSTNNAPLDTCMSSSFTAGSAGNTVGLVASSPIDLSAASALVSFEANRLSDFSQFGSSQPTPSPSVTPTSTPTPTPTTTPSVTPSPTVSPTPSATPSPTPSTTPTIQPTLAPSVRVSVPTTYSRINNKPYDLFTRSASLTVSVTGSIPGLTATINGVSTPIQNSKLALPSFNGDYKVILRSPSTTYFSQTIRLRHPDYNRDNTTNIADLNLLNARINLTYRSTYTVYDLNLDGKLDASDVARLQSYWGK